jgi:hypothetical protein
MGHGKSHRSGGAGHSSSDHPGHAPGKRTLTESMHSEPPPAARQLQLQDVAAQGVAGPGAALPHLDQIQRSFGKHDVSQVRAHVGGRAAEATENMGTTGYAVGNDVALRDASSLHTAAHEAAHVVQQRAGVQLAGGVGAAGDQYERNADAVADRVVRGESAEDLLAPYAGGSGSGTAVQMYSEANYGKFGFDRISDDGRIAVDDHSTDAWAEPDLVAKSNKILERNKAKAKIEPESGLRKVKAAGREHYLQKIKMVDRGASWWTRNFGDNEVDLTNDCGTANGQMMGAEASGRRAFVAAGQHGANQEFTGESAYHPDDLEPGGDVSTTEKLSGELYTRIMKREFGKTLSRVDALREWAALTDLQRKELSKKYGLNEYAAPKVGQGVTIGSERDAPGAVLGGYNFHFALNLISAGDDYLSLEDYHKSGVKYYFKMYGPASKGQAFAQEQDNVNALGNKTTSMVVVHPHMIAGKTTKAVEMLDATTRAAAGKLDKNTRVKILQQNETELEVEILSGSRTGQRGWISAAAYKSD